MSGKRRASEAAAAEYAAQLAEHFEVKPEAAPERAPGVKWPLERLLAAERRAAGKPWIEIAQLVGRALDTCRGWTRDPDWMRLVAWYEERLLFARREVWLREEQTLCVEGLRAAHGAYARIMRGEADATGQIPTVDQQLRAAREYFEAIGYSDSRRLIARAEIAEQLNGGGGGGGSADGAPDLSSPHIIDIGIKGV